MEQTKVFTNASDEFVKEEFIKARDLAVKSLMECEDFVVLTHQRNKPGFKQSIQMGAPVLIDLMRKHWDLIRFRCMCALEKSFFHELEENGNADQG